MSVCHSAALAWRLSCFVLVYGLIAPAAFATEPDDERPESLSDGVLILGAPLPCEMPASECHPLRPSSEKCPLSNFASPGVYQMSGYYCPGADKEYVSPLAPSAEQQAREILGLIESLGPSVLDGSLFEPRCAEDKKAHAYYLIDLCQPCEGHGASHCDHPCAADDGGEVFGEFRGFDRTGGDKCRLCEEQECPECRRAHEGHLRRGCCASGNEGSECRHPHHAMSDPCDDCPRAEHGYSPTAYAPPCPAPPGCSEMDENCPPAQGTFYMDFAPRLPYGQGPHVAQAAPPVPCPAPNVWPTNISIPAMGQPFFMPIGFDGAPPGGEELDRTTLLRTTASRLDDMADQLEEAEEFDSADALRSQADRLRKSARGTTPVTSQAQFTTEEEELEETLEVTPDQADSLRQRLRESLEAMRAGDRRPR